MTGQRPSVLDIKVIIQTLDDVFDERLAQINKWGEQAGNHPDGTGGGAAVGAADHYRMICQQHAAEGKVTFRDILAEEVYEAFAESDPALLREELIQVAAVAVQWVEAIDRREGRI